MKLKFLVSLTAAAFMLLTIIVSKAQTNYNLPPAIFYKEATLSFKNLDRKKVRDLSIEGDSIRFFNNGKKTTSHLNTINYIRIKEGNKAGTGALIGGASMLVISASASLQAQSSPYYNDPDDNSTELIVGLTVAGTLIGALIGGASPKEKSFYVHTKQ